MVMLQSVIRSAIDMARTASPQYSTAWPTAPFEPIRAITNNPRPFRFAMSAPYYVMIGDQPRVSRSASQFFLDWIAARERQLRAQVQALKVEIDQERRKKDVSDVVDSDFFKDLQTKAADMRRRVKGDE